MKQFRRLLTILIILPCILITAFSHPGDTDSDGGHKDHASGVYHYHHGYEAHGHLDIDGDGDLDCPIDFYNQSSFSNSPSSDSTTITDAGSLAKSNFYTSFYILLAVLMSIVGISVPVVIFYRAFLSPPSDDFSECITSAAIPPAQSTDCDRDLKPVVAPLPVSPKVVPPDSFPIQLCKTIWKEVFRYRFFLKYTLSHSSLAYLWTILFYSVIKSLRSQSIANEIYSVFTESTVSLFSDKEKGHSFCDECTIVYKAIAPMLNRSEIDPRTDAGKELLWTIFCDYTFKDSTYPSDAKERFFIAIKNAVSNTHSLCATAPSQIYTPVNKSPQVQYSISLPSEAE